MIPFRQGAFVVALLCTLPACIPTTLVDADLSHVIMVAGSKCAIAKIADLPVTMSAGHILVPVQVDGSERLFILDTGAYATSVTPELANALRLSKTPEWTSFIGIGGAARTQNVEVKDLVIGGFHFRGTELSTVPLSRPAVSEAQAAGLLGAPFLSAFDLEVDLPHHRVALYGSRHCADGFLPWAPPYSTLSANVTSQGHVIVTATLDGKPLSATLDTGAPRSLMTSHAAATLGLTAEGLAADANARATGVGLLSINTRVHHFSRLSLGAQTFDHPTIAIGDARFDTDLLIGLDVLATHSVWFGYDTHQVFMGQAVPDHVAGKSE